LARTAGLRLRVAHLPRRITVTDANDAAIDLAGELLGRPLELPLGPVPSPRSDTY